MSTPTEERLAQLIESLEAMAERYTEGAQRTRDIVGPPSGRKPHHLENQAIICDNVAEELRQIVRHA